MAQIHATTDRGLPQRRTRVRRASLVEFPLSRPVVAAHRHLGVSQKRAASPKHRLAFQINRLLDEQRLSQLVAAERLGISQSKVSAIRNYKLHGISLGRLMEALVALDQRVTIVVRPRAAPYKEAISVVL